MTASSGILRVRRRPGLGARALSTRSAPEVGAACPSPVRHGTRARIALGVAGALGALLSATACSGGSSAPSPTTYVAAPTGGAATSGGTPANPSGPAAPSGPSGPVRLIGDGSTADTGPQPNQPAPPTKLKPGERPPQFVVVSWDGAGADRSGLFETWREFAAAHHVPMTFFLTGLYMLPASHRTAYTSPGRAAGASAIPWFGDEAIRATIENVRAAWLKGHEIGTHFNGHFCGPKGGSSWSPADWDHEIAQAKQFVSTWRTTTGFDLPPLPFDYEKELVGARTPCLEGQAGLVKASAVANWRYDSSGAGTQVWPRKLSGTSLWNIPLELIPFNGSQVLSMDYNFYATQSRAKTGDPASYAGWQAQARDAYLAGFQRAYTANRAPLIIGNHFESWNGGIYMAALREALTQMVSQPDVRFVTFKQLCDWLDAQDPAVLASLQRLPVGQAPTAGWTKTS